MADRPVQETASRPATGVGNEPSATGPVLPPMPEGASKSAPNGRPARGRKAARQTPPPAPANDDTAVSGKPVRARLRSDAPRSAPTAGPAPTAAGRPPMSPMPDNYQRPPAPASGRPAPAAAGPAAPIAPPTAPGRAPTPTQTQQVRPVATAAPHRPARRARLRLTRIDPWSVMKTAFLLSIAVGIVTVIAVMTVWAVLGAAGVWDSINSSVASVLGGEDGTNFNVTDYVGLSRVLGFTTLVAVADVVLLTAMATLAAFLYNMAAALLGGIDVTLAEED